jgi:hypothetical protein
MDPLCPGRPAALLARCLALGCLLFALLGGFSAPALALQPSDLPRCPTGRPNCIALALWLPASRADDLSGWLTSQLNTANRLLGSIDAGVQVAEIRDLPQADTDIATTTHRTQLGLHGKQAPLRWFVVQRLVDDADKAKTRRGVTWRNGPQVWVIEDESANAWVLVHELGHVLGLGHSTEAWSVMNKAKRWQMITGRLEFTARERPVMRRTLAALLAAGRLVKGK